MHEFAVAGRLRDFGVREYVPIQRTARRSSRSKFKEGRPLFPGYVFSFLNLQTGPKLYGIQGVMQIVGYGGRPMPIEEQEIAMVRSIADSCLPIEPVSSYQFGDKIRLITGPLAGVSGVFIRTATGNKLVVSLPLLQRSLAVTVESDWVAAEHRGCRQAHPHDR